MQHYTLSITVQDRYALQDYYKPQKTGVYDGNIEMLNSKNPGREEIQL